jgi:hypothetical protein
LEELLPIVLDVWDLVMTTREYLSWISMDKLLVESLTEACVIFQYYSQLHMFLLASPNTFIIDNSMRTDRQWQRTWRVVRPRPPDMSAFTTYNRIELDHGRNIVETLCMMVSIIGQLIAKNTRGDRDTDTHEGEHMGLPTVIRLTHEHL